MDLIRTEGLLIFHKLERHIVVYCGVNNGWRFSYIFGRSK